MADAVEQIRELEARLAWRMLATFGAPVRAERITGSAVDPECVLLLASICAEHDARCAELALWFSAAAHSALALGRAARIATTIGLSAEQALDRFAATAAATTHSSSDVRAWSNGRGTSNTTPWNISHDPDRLGKRIGQDLAVGAALHEPGAIRLKVRMAMGTGARAEALAMLLVEAHFWKGRGEGWLTLLELETGTGYGKRFLLDTLPDMAAAGMLQHQRTGRTHRFSIAPALIEASSHVPESWGNWVLKLTFLEALKGAVQAVDTSRTITTALEQSRALQQVAPRFDPFVSPQDPDAVVHHFESYCVRAARHVTDVG